MRAPTRTTAAAAKPPSGWYRIRAQHTYARDRCFDVGYGTGWAPMVVQFGCDGDGPERRYQLEALGSGKYRIKVVPLRSADNAGVLHCASATGTNQVISLKLCSAGRSDQVFTISVAKGQWFQVKAAAGCMTIIAPDPNDVEEAHARACTNSQAQRFVFQLVG